MLWVVQQDLFIENKRGALLAALDRLDIPFLLVKVSNNRIEPDVPVDNDSPIITNGSIMLSNIANARGWWPGSLFNENFSYEVWSDFYGPLLLNKDAVFSTLGAAVPELEKVFVRPVADTKTFNGRVFERDEFLQFQQDSLCGKPGAPSPATPILWAAPKKVGQEHRHYIVDGQVVTSSRYKLAGQPNFSEGADAAVLDVVRKAIALWQPARAFVLDTYTAGNEVGIVEIGGICHAGLYEADLIKLVHALDSMEPQVELAPIGTPRFAFKA